MKTRSKLSLCTPLALFIAASLLSLSTFVIAIVWMTIGVIALGHRSFESFPSNGIGWRWLRGYRAAIVWFDHLARWPWYMRSSTRDVPGQIEAAVGRTKELRGERRDDPSYDRSDGDCG